MLQVLTDIQVITCNVQLLLSPSEGAGLAVPGIQPCCTQCMAVHIIWHSALLHTMHGCSHQLGAHRMLWNLRAVPLGKRPHLRPHCYFSFLLNPTVHPSKQLVSFAQHPLAAS